MKGALLGYISACLLTLMIISGPVRVSGVPSVLRHRRQDDFVTTEEPTTTTEINFEKLLEDMFKNLGMDINETDTKESGEATTFPTSAIAGELGNPDTTNFGEYTTSTGTPSWETWPVSGATGEATGSAETPLPGTGAATSIGGSSTTYIPENDTFLSTALPEDVTTRPTEYQTPPSTPPFYTTISTKKAEISETTTSQSMQVCYVTPVLRDFCILPDDLTDVLGPSVTLHDLSDLVLSMDVVYELIDKCSAGSWCLNSKHSYDHLEEKLAFWMNSSDFLNLCWPPLDSCLRTVVDYYTECENYEMYLMIEDMNKLLCEMKEEPRASRDCIEQTMKALHVSMADFHRSKQDLEDNEDTNICQRRKARMQSNFMCATAVCGVEDGDLLSEFEPWNWFVDSVEIYRAMCVFDQAQCVTKREEAAEVEEEEKEEETIIEEENQQNTEPIDGELTDVDDDDDKSKGVWVTEEMDIPSTVIIGAISLATVGFFVLLAAIWWIRQRRKKHRIREGVEYMQILPDMDD